MAPAARLVPERGPDMIVVADDEQIEIAGSARYNRNLLMSTIEHRLSGQAKPVIVPRRHVSAPFRNAGFLQSWEEREISVKDPILPSGLLNFHFCDVWQIMYQ